MKVLEVVVGAILTMLPLVRYSARVLRPQKDLWYGAWRGVGDGFRILKKRTLQRQFNLVFHCCICSRHMLPSFTGHIFMTSPSTTRILSFGLSFPFMLLSPNLFCLRNWLLLQFNLAWLLVSLSLPLLP